MPLQNPMHKSIRVTLICTVLSIGSPALAQGMGADPMIAWILGGVALLCCLIMLPIFWTTGRRYLREMQELVGGQHLAHWQVDPADWERFTEEDWLRGRREAIRTPLWIVGIGLACCLVIVWLGGGLNEAVLFMAAIFAGLAALIGGVMYASVRSTYQQRLRTPGEIYIGAKGVLNGASYHSWVGFGVSLTGVALEESDPYAICFQITTNAGENTSTTEVRVPVPRGREEEAVRLVAQFHGEE